MGQIMSELAILQKYYLFEQTIIYNNNNIDAIIDFIIKNNSQMNIQALRFKAVSHLPEGQLVEYLTSIKDNPLPNRYSAPQRIQRIPQRNGLQVKRPAGFPMAQQRQQQPMRDSVIDAFSGSNQHLEINKIKEQCSKLRFEKIALENALQKLRQQNARKDQIIRGLTAQVNVSPIPNSQGLRHTIMPHY